MPVQHFSFDTIEDFLAQKRIAMVGISRESGDFSAYLLKELCRRGHHVVPVNPNASSLPGRPCFAHVQDIEPPVEGVLLMTSPDVTDAVVRDCAEAGIRARLDAPWNGGQARSATRLSSSAASMASA